MVANMNWARNLNKSQLGGVIFGCTNSTMEECLSSQLFGLPAQHFMYVKNIEPGLPLFLFNYSERKLHGVYEAASSGKMNIDSYAWTAGGSDRTQYPAQVQIRVRLICQPLAEQQFKPIIADNYYNPNHFRFELDHVQASKLISILSSLAVGPRTLTPKKPKKKAVVIKGSPSEYKIKESGASELPPLVDAHCMDGNNNELKEAASCRQNYEMRQPDEQELDLIYMKLKEQVLGREDASIIEGMVGSASTGNVDFEREKRENDLTTSGKWDAESTFNALDYPAVISQLYKEMVELKAFKEEQALNTENLKKKLVEAEHKIHQLENRCMILESISNPSTSLSGNEALVGSDEMQLNLDESIFILGGYNGVSWSSAFHSFSPSRDVLRSHKPMSCVRGNASVARLDRELYVFGGGADSVLYDTVESYNTVDNQWTVRPSLNAKKGGLAVAALNGKFFSVGGGNDVECFSDVEMFDPDVGRWISARSMLQKRFGVAVVEFHGALYAVGGYDGKDYLKSAERFDPREHSWTTISSMDTERSGHSLVVLNEKLYAIGGHDGQNMVASVEIYDPRVGTWMAGEAMNQSRGYLAAAVVKESIYVIGGFKENSDIVDMIECYKEGEGWQATNLGPVGKLCLCLCYRFRRGLKKMNLLKLMMSS